jgi:hypothetical protein
MIPREIKKVILKEIESCVRLYKNSIRIDCPKVANNYIEIAMENIEKIIKDKLL